MSRSDLFTTVIIRTSPTSGQTYAIWPYQPAQHNQSRLACINADGTVTTFATMNYHQFVAATNPASAASTTEIVGALNKSGHNVTVAYRLNPTAYRNR